jgi:hypothetical protein
MKLLGNFCILSLMQAIRQSMELADCNELDRQTIVRFIKEAFPGPIAGGNIVWRTMNAKSFLFLLPPCIVMPKHQSCKEIWRHLPSCLPVIMIHWIQHHITNNSTA